MVFGAVLAVLVAQLFGKSIQTDAFFAAYGFYSLGVTFTYTVRLTAVSRLVGSASEAVTRQLGAALLIALAFGVPMLILAGPLGRVLVESDPTGVARATLRILWVALTGQLLAAMLATILAVQGSFNTIGIATLLAGPVTIATFLLAEPATGIDGAAIGISAGAAWLVAVLGGKAVRSGWRPRVRDLAALGAMAAEALRLTFASATFLGATVAYVTCLAVAARQGAGEATLFAYAFVLVGMLLGVTTNVLAMVRSPSLLASSERTADAASTAVWGLRLTLVLAGPALAMVLLVGKPLIGFLLGSGFSAADVESLLVTLACLVGWLVATAAGIFAVVELLARGALVPLALLAAGQVGVLAPTAWAGAELAGIYGIAAALSVVTLGVTLVQLRWAFGGTWREPVGTMARASARELMVLAAAFAPSAALLLVVGQTAITTAAAGVLAAALVAVATFVAWPRESRALLALVR
jgi:peptidoglycan biosynthesis protein MviN/MurJ (putative lipid II flippase)